MNERWNDRITIGFHESRRFIAEMKAADITIIGEMNSSKENKRIGEEGPTTDSPWGMSWSMSPRPSCGGHYFGCSLIFLA